MRAAVIEAKWIVFEEAVRCARNIDELRNAHQAMLRTLLKECMLSRASVFLVRHTAR